MVLVLYSCSSLAGNQDKGKDRIAPNTNHSIYQIAGEQFPVNKQMASEKEDQAFGFVQSDPRSKPYQIPGD